MCHPYVGDHSMLRILVLVAVIVISGCSGGAVVFAPTPPPPDLSPLLYTHPSGAFSVAVPRQWSVYVQNITELAAASFASPGEDEPPLRFAVMNLGESMDSAALRQFIDQYQTTVRPDVEIYSEVDRGAMGDGSWRLTGLRSYGNGITRQVNTFIQQVGTFVGVIEVLLPGDPSRQQELQSIINTFKMNTDATLQPAPPSALAFAAPSSLNFLHVTTWTTPAGVFFVTGEVGNYGTVWVNNVPVRAVLLTPDGLPVVEAADTIMGHGIPPGGFAPFSLRFGGGQPALATDYQLILGDSTWDANQDRSVLDQSTLNWTDDSSINADGRLSIRGTVTNSGAANAYNVRAVITVFDPAGDVIAAGYADVSPAIAPGTSADFNLIVPEMGGTPANYIVNVQALP
jgi:hypothetical protein